MRLRLRSFLLTSALTFAPAIASATTISGLYVDGGAGYNEVQDQHVHANSTPNGDAVSKFSVNHGTGFTGFAAVGWGFGNGLRVEAEGLYNFSHDNYTSSQYETGYTNYTYKKGEFNYTYKKGELVTGYNPIYTAVPGAQQVPCITVHRKYFPGYTGMPFWLPGYDTTGFLENSGNSNETTIPSNNWDWTPADKCYYINPTETIDGLTGTQIYNDLHDSLAGKYNAYNGYQDPQDGKWINPLPGVYSDKLDNTYNFLDNTYKLDNTYASKNVTNINVLRGYPFYAYRRTLWENHNGSDESWGGFANVLYDFDLERLFGVKSIATPFIGGGAGYLWQRYNRPNTMIAAITGTHGGFSWQGIAGVAFDTGISGLQVVAQYRMIGQPGSFYNGTFNYGTEDGHAHFDQRFNHQFIVGFRYAFQNRPVHIAPPSVSRAFATSTAAAPAPVPARSYLVFFDWNQYALTSRARQIVLEAAHATSYVHTTRINVNGYTDSSAAPGPAGQKYNYALSVKRARSVEAELIRNGVPASEIVIRGYGDTNPLVPTAPNTREPQNRRVEIILHA